MRKRVVVSVLAWVLALTAFGQHAGYRPVADIVAFKKEFATQSKKINSITSSFRQQKTLTALTESITSEGLFSFKRMNKVRIEYKKPFSYLMVMQGDKMMVRDDSRENTVNLKSNKLFQQINRIVVDCIQGTILDSKDFSSQVFENKNEYLLELTPTAKNLKGFFQTILLVVNKKDYSVETIRLNEPSGDFTLMSFFDKQINTNLADQVFAF